MKYQFLEKKKLKILKSFWILIDDTILTLDFSIKIPKSVKSVFTMNFVIFTNNKNKMLSVQDFMEKQIVIVSCDELKEMILKNENLAVYKDGKIVHQISVFKIFCVFVM